MLDFGVAKITETSSDRGGTLTGGHTIVGTPAYMAPEQLREKVDARADEYSLGVMTYGPLTGDLRFGITTLIDIGIKHAGPPGQLTGGASHPACRGPSCGRSP